MTQTTTKQAAIFKAGCYNYHTLIIHLFAQEILGQALQLSYVSLTRLSSHVACESLVCETRNAVFKKKLEKSFVGKLWLQSRAWNEMGGARNWPVMAESSEPARCCISYYFNCNWFQAVIRQQGSTEKNDPSIWQQSHTYEPPLQRITTLGTLVIG